MRSMHGIKEESPSDNMAHGAYVIMRKIPSYRAEHFSEDCRNPITSSAYFFLIDMIIDEAKEERKAYDKSRAGRR